MKFSKVSDKKAQEYRHLYLFNCKCNVSSTHRSNSKNVCYQSRHFATWISKVHVSTDLPQVDLMNFRVEYVRTKDFSESRRYQQRHNLLAYMMYIYSILSLQCIIGRFSTRAVFGRFVAVFWSIFLVTKAKQDQSGSFCLFNLLCEWFLIDFLRRLRSPER